MQRGRSLADLRQDNMQAVFARLRLEGELTRSQICEATGLTVPTVGGILNHLMQLGLVKTTNRVRTGGRRALSYSLNSRALRVIAVDVRVQEMVAALVDIEGQILSQRHAPAEYGSSGPLFTRQLMRMVGELWQEAERDQSRPLAIGIALPAFLDEESGRIFFMPSIRGEGLPLPKVMSRRFGVPTYAENDARVGVLAEVWWRARHLNQTVAYVVADYGVGSGVAINGALVRGHAGAAGDIGHAVIDPRGKRCWCGQSGCLETFISFPALMQRMSDAGVAAGSLASLSEVVRAAQDDARIRSVLLEAAEYLSVGINMINVMLGPHAIYLGGALADAWALIAPTLHQFLERSPQAFGRPAVLQPSTHGDMAGVTGAAALAFQNVLQPNTLAGTSHPFEWNSGLALT